MQQNIFEPHIKIEEDESSPDTYRTQTHILPHFIEGKEILNEITKQCLVCLKVFASKAGLIRHVSTIHQRHLHHYQCHCGKVFKTPNTFKYHLGTHNADIFRCEMCGFNSKHRGSLYRHIMNHLKKKTYKCKQCGASFSESYNLQRHSYSHLATKPYRCEICSRCFSQSTTLKEHINTHTGVKPYKCHLCSYGCKRRSTLGEHLMKHKRPMPRPCAYCGKKFKRKTMLLRHIEQRHVSDEKDDCVEYKDTIEIVDIKIEPHERFIEES